MKKLIFTAALTLLTAGAFAQTTPTAPTVNNQAPTIAANNPAAVPVTSPSNSNKLGKLKKDIKGDVKDVRADMKDERMDIKDLRADIKQRRIDIKNGDKSAALGLTRDIKNDRRDIRLDRRDIRLDRKDIRQDLRQAHRLASHRISHPVHSNIVAHKATPVK